MLAAATSSESSEITEKTGPEFSALESMPLFVQFGWLVLW